jgi:hypothetical protein
MVATGKIRMGETPWVTTKEAYHLVMFLASADGAPAGRGERYSGLSAAAAANGPTASATSPLTAFLD